MKTKIHKTIEINSSDHLESMTNFNQSFNENNRYREFLPQGKRRTSWETLKHLSLPLIICLIIFPILFIVIGMIYRNSCFAKPNVPLFLIIFGLLILINLLIYTIAGATFLALIRHARSFSFENGIGLLIATFAGIIFGMMIFIWWILGTIWWIKLTLSIRPQLKHPTSLAFCHPMVYWTALAANIFGLIGFIIQICIAIGGDMTASKQVAKNRG